MALTKVKAGNILLTTPSASSNDVTPATTQYVTTALANLADSAPSTLNTLNELAAALGDDANFSTTVTTSIATKAPLASPTFTGTITGPHIISTSNTATQFKNATDTDVQHKLETNAGADFAIHRLIGSDGVDNKFIIGYGPNHGSTPNQVALKATHSSGTIGLYTGASSTNALTIDSSQDAIFSSDVNIAGTTKLDGGNGYFRDGVGNSFSTGWDSTSDDHSTWINFEGYQGGTTKFRDLRIGNGKQTAFVHFDGSASTSNFSGNIYLSGSNDRRIKLSDSGIGGVSDSNNTVHIRGDNDFMKLNAAGNGGFIFEENGAERMRIAASTGKVGIGTNSPDDKLDIMGGGYDQIRIGSNKTDNTNKTAGIVSTMYTNNSVSFMQGFFQNGNNAVYYGSADGAHRGLQHHYFYTNSNYNATSGHALQMTISSSGVAVANALSKGSGSFKIDHPLEAKKDTHHLVHSFVEGPQADLIYRGKVDLSSGTATVNIDTEAGMTEGTFAALNTDVQCFTSNESDWDAVKGSVSGNILTISCENSSSTATISWMVVGERQDPHIIETNWTDSNGKVIVEPLKPEE